MKTAKYIVKELLRRYGDHQLQQIGGSLAYFFLLAIFPLLIFLNALLGFFGFALQDVLLSIAPVIPTSAFEILDGYIQSISGSNNTTLLSFGLIGALYSASIAVTSLIHAIFRAYNQRNHRNWFATKGLAVLFTFLIGIALTASLFLPLIGQGFFDFLQQYIYIPEWIIGTWNRFRWIATPLIIMLTLALIYKIIPYTPYKQSIWPGTVFAVVGWSLASFAFSIYVNQFANYSAVYGSIGAIIAMMVWLFITGIVIILGAELNDILDQLKQIKSE